MGDWLLTMQRGGRVDPAVVSGMGMARATAAGIGRLQHDGRCIPRNRIGTPDDSVADP